MIGVQTMVRKPPHDEDKQLRAMKRIVRKAERRGGDGTLIGGMGYTVLKQCVPPVHKLFEQNKIEDVEIQAAEQISRAFHALSCRLMVRGMSLERIDKGAADHLPLAATAAEAVANYQAWANHWSKRRVQFCDPLLEIVISAVIDERPLTAIRDDLGFGLRKVETAVIGGLRDYAARAGMVSGRVVHHWITAAESIFVVGNPVLLEAVRRAKIEV